MYVRIKICCISSIKEARIAMGYGADAIGLVGEMPSGPGIIPEKKIAAIAKTVRAPIASFLLTSEQSARGIVDHVKRVQTNTVQIVDELAEGTYDEIRLALPYLHIVQVIHVTNEKSIQKAIALQSFVDALLLDSGDPEATIKLLGGTGITHNWNISKEIVKAVKVPVFLAGGLDADNVQEAIEKVQPFAVDVCSGVRTKGKLDKRKLRDFFNAVRP